MRPTLILLVAFTLSYWPVPSMDLKQAIASKLVAVEVSGANYDSMPVSMRNGFSPAMQMTVSNLSNQPVQLDLGPGYMLEASEPDYQAMLLTQSINLKLRPKERQHNYLYAMCTQLTKSGPNPSLHYHVAEKAKPSLLRMALFIASKKYLVHAAQEAVWSISDNLPIPSIDDKDPHITDDLQKEVADIKHVNLEDVRKEYKNSKGAALAEFNGSKTDRNIPFDVKDTSVVAVAYYDLNGSPIKIIIKPTMLMQGKHSIRYEPYPVALAGQKYSVKMLKDGSPYKEYYFMQ